PHAVYTFKHVLVRDAAYSSLLKSRRATMHAAIASAFEQRFPEIVEAEPETLAHHLTEAGLHEKAVSYWLKAGKNAVQRFANLEAIAHLQQGLEAACQLPESSARDRLELDVQVALGPCLMAAQGPASSTAIATFARSRELCSRLGDPPEYLQVLFWLATGSVIRGELPQAREATTTLLGLAEARNDRPMLINAIRGLGMILLFMGHLVEARELTERAIVAFSTSSDSEKLAARAAGQDAGVAGPGADVVGPLGPRPRRPGGDANGCRASTCRCGRAPPHTSLRLLLCIHSARPARRAVSRAAPCRALPRLVRGTRIPALAWAFARHSRHLHDNARSVGERARGGQRRSGSVPQCWLSAGHHGALRADVSDSVGPRRTRGCAGDDRAGALCSEPQ